LDLVEQLFIGGGIAALGFAGVMLLGAPRRVWAMTSHLHRALLGRIPAEPNFL
jgi:DMSO/TMAO reductase YedYZ heme-binding membrane subunit